MIGFRRVPSRSISCEVQPGTIAGWTQRKLPAAASSRRRLLRLRVFWGWPDVYACGDASGKGVAAALMMASVQASLRTAAQFTGNNLPALFRAANDCACASSLADRYATLFYGVMNPAALTLRYVNAGHNPPVVVHCDGSVDWLEPSGAPVGLFPNATWREEVIHLHPGDLVLAYTDGVIETSGPSGQEWGIEGLLQAAEARRLQSADEIVRSIFDSMDAFSGRRSNRRCDGHGITSHLRRRFAHPSLKAKGKSLSSREPPELVIIPAQACPN